MASQIDPTKPVTGTIAFKADLRGSLTAAKNEIEALQADVATLQAEVDALQAGGGGGGGGSALVDTLVTASRPLALTDAGGKMLRANHATVPIVLTVPANASVAFPLGTVIQVLQAGAAEASVAAAGGVTVNKPADRSLAVRVQHEVISLWKQAQNVWHAYGALGTGLTATSVTESGGAVTESGVLVTFSG